MSAAALIYPALVHVALTFGLLLMTGRSRLGAISAGQVKVADIALGERNWPAQPTKFANAYQNQFELPVLFYALVAFLLVTRTAGYLDLVLAWIFVVSRIVHATVHVTTNRLNARFGAFVVGVITLAVMWIVFAVRLIAVSILCWLILLYY